MEDLRSSLATEIRNRAQSELDRAAFHERHALADKDLARVLYSIAGMLERGEINGRASELLDVARPRQRNLLNSHEESEIDRLRRVFGLDGASLLIAIDKMP